MKGVEEIGNSLGESSVDGVHTIHIMKNFP